MKIAYLSTFHPFRGGIRQFNENLSLAFLELGHSVKPYTFKRQYPEMLFPGSSQYDASSLKDERLFAPQLLDTIWPPTWFQTAEELKKAQPDLLLMKFWLPFFGPSLGTVAHQLKKKGTKVITILDNAIPHEKRPLDKSFTQFFLKQNSGFITMSSTVKADLLSLQPEAKFLSLVHPLYDNYGEVVAKEKARKELGIPLDKKVLLYFGFIREYKGVDVLLDAFATLGPDYFLVVAGEPYIDWKPYQQQIDANPNKDRILALPRFIESSEVNNLFSASDLSVLPYKDATQSGVLAMSTHFELPSLATEVGSLPEMISTLRCGRTCPANQPLKMAEAINDLFNTKKEANNQSILDIVNDIRVSKQTYTWDYFAKAIINFYTTV